MVSANYEYSRSNRENLPLPIEIKLSKKAWNFFRYFFGIFVCTWNFQCSEKKKEPYRSGSSEVIDFKPWAYLNA